MIPIEDKNKPDPPPANLPVKIEISKELRKLFTVADIRPEEITALDEALTHSSYANEMSGEIPNNERLELLGDAVIELIVREYLFKRFPDYAEGKMTQIKTNLVNTFALARVAKRISLADNLLLGRGEKASGGKRKPTILAQTFEAIIGAIYLSVGLERTARLVLEAMEEEINRWLRMKESLDIKGQLQKYVQKERGIIPLYVTREYGNDMFISIVYIQEEVIGSGIGRNKKEAEKRSAFEALKHLGVIKAGEEKRPGRRKKKELEAAKSGETPPKVDIRFRRPGESLVPQKPAEPATSIPQTTEKKTKTRVKKKRPRRLFRKKEKTKQPEQQTVAAEIAPASILPTIPEPALAPEAVTESRPAKPRRKWRQRKPKPRPETVAAEITPASILPTIPEPTSTSEVVTESKPAKPRRRWRQRKPKPRPETVAAEITPASILPTIPEPTSTSEVVTESKPAKPRRRWRQRKPKPRPGTWERK